MPPSASSPTLCWPNWVRFPHAAHLMVQRRELQTNELTKWEQTALKIQINMPKFSKCLRSASYPNTASQALNWPKFDLNFCWQASFWAFLDEIVWSSSGSRTTNEKEKGYFFPQPLSHYSVSTHLHHSMIWQINFPAVGTNCWREGYEGKSHDHKRLSIMYCGIQWFFIVLPTFICIYFILLHIHTSIYHNAFKLWFCPEIWYLILWEDFGMAKLFQGT